MKKFISILKMKKVYIPLIAIIVIVAAVMFFGGNSNKNFETALVVRSDFAEEVSVTGKVVAAEAVDLAFENSGKIASVPVEVGALVKKGQLLASLNSGDSYASLLNAQAKLDAERVELNEMRNGTRSEELQLVEDDYEQAQLAFDVALTDSYLKADDAVRGKTDELFTDAESNPVFLPIKDYEFQQDIEKQREEIGDMLDKWNENKESMNVAQVKVNLLVIDAYLNDLTTALNLLSDTGYESAATVAGYKSSVSSARAQVSSANSNITTADKAVVSAEGDLKLKEAGSTTYEIQAKEALVKSMEASVLQAQTSLGKTMIRAPFDGVISKIDFKVGQFVGSGTEGLSLVSAANFEIESFIPEADIAKIKMGDKAEVTLDAYGDEVFFNAVITQIDLSDTQVEGVSTYKTVLQFEKPDERIKSGMTANIDIQNEIRPNVLNIPQTSIINESGVKTVLVMDEEGKTKSQTVKTGNLDGKGNIEITEGLEEGDKVVVNPPQKP